MIFVLFDQQIGALHLVPRSNSLFNIFHIFPRFPFTMRQKKKKRGNKELKTCKKTLQMVTPKHCLTSKCWSSKQRLAVDQHLSVSSVLHVFFHFCLNFCFFFTSKWDTKEEKLATNVIFFNWWIRCAAPMRCPIYTTLNQLKS